jgi:hypothetical protein
VLAFQQKADQPDEGENAHPEEAKLTGPSRDVPVFCQIVVIVIQDCHWRLPTLLPTMVFGLSSCRNRNVVTHRTKSSAVLQCSNARY